MQAYDEVVRRFGDATEPTAREQAARALVNKGIALRLGDLLANCWLTGVAEPAQKSVVGLDFFITAIELAPSPTKVRP